MSALTIEELEEQTIDELLIQAVKARPVLWQKKHPKYKDRNINMNAWASVAECSGLPPGDAAQKKWTNLRNRFGREIRREQVASGGAPVPASTWPLYRAMEFIRDQITPRSTITMDAEPQGKEFDYGDISSRDSSNFETGASSHSTLEEELTSIAREVDNTTPEDFLSMPSSKTPSPIETASKRMRTMLPATTPGCSRVRKSDESVTSMTAILANAATGLQNIAQRKTANLHDGLDPDVFSMAINIGHKLQALPKNMRNMVEVDILRLIAGVDV